MLMWKKAKCVKLPVLTLHLLDDAEQTVLRCRIDLFPFAEAVVLQACMEYFHDPAPCEIHRSAVRLRLCAEIEAAVPAGQSRRREELPPKICGYLQGYSFRSRRLEKE